MSVVSIAIERYQAACLPHLYTLRNASKGLLCLLASYCLPSLGLGLGLNLLVTLLLHDLHTDTHYLFLSLIFKVSRYLLDLYLISKCQIVHPLFTTIIIPMFLLVIINYKIIKKCPISSNSARLSVLLLRYSIFASL